MSRSRPRGEPNAAGERRGSRLSPFTVSEINAAADASLRTSLGSAWVAGEIVRFLAHRSGHWYFNLTDGDSVISCAMFRSRNARTPFEPHDGMEVVVQGTPAIYAVQGRYQIVVDAMEPRGRGAAALALEQLKRKLADEGLFAAERKRPLPVLPRTIGIATSVDGAAIKDVLQVLERRFAGVHCIVADTLVQGPGAPAAIIAALDALEAREPDVLLLVRGGGSPEDLAAFNDERLVRRVAASRIPIVTGIGHEIDTSLADLAADLRAATPSAAAELVIAERAEMADRIARLGKALSDRMHRRLENARGRLARLAGAPGMGRVPREVQTARVHAADLAFRAERTLLAALKKRRAALHDLSERLAPETRLKKIALRRLRFDRMRGALREGIARRLVGGRRRLATSAASLDALSPLAVLNRGFALVTRERRDGPLVDAAERIAAGDKLYLRFARGGATAEVLDVEPPERVVPRGADRPEKTT